MNDYLKPLALTLLLLCWSTLALTEEEGDENSVYREPPGWQIGVTTGPYMPRNITGMRELLPMTGIRISTDLSVFRPEMALLVAHAKGYDYYLGHFSWRNVLPLYGFQTFWLWGINMSYFNKDLSSTQKSSLITHGGAHGGVGMFFPMGPNLRFRFDSLFGLGPGKTVYVGVGFNFRFSSESTKKTN